MIYSVQDINNSFNSYQQIIKLYETFKDAKYSSIPVSLDGWFGANMSSALGCVLDVLSLNFNDVKLHFSSDKLQKTLQKNKFLSYYGYSMVNDDNHTTIPFQKLRKNDDKYFNSYVMNELLAKEDLPSMSKLLKDKIAEAICEIFVNAQIHSLSPYIYTCGQFFPNKKTIEFTITDNGIGFRENVKRRFGRSIDSCAAIKWAIQDGNTTKIDISGGIGLALLKEFIILNNGKIQIVSYEGMYEFSNQKEEINTFTGEFPGTIVNLQFRTDDTNAYCLKKEKELTDQDIF